MKVLGIIPARYASTRFPAKALADIGGKPMIQCVYEQASKAGHLDHVVVATDDERIESVVKSFGGEAVMTSTDHQSGTDRCREVIGKLSDFDYVVNIQGDEPFIQPEQIDLLAELLDGDVQLATLVKKLEDQKELFDPNVVKCVFNSQNNALYFSRSAIPHARGSAQEDWLEQRSYFKHIGIYGYRSDILQKISELSESNLEKTEALEQLRWLDHGYQIKVAETTIPSIGIDTPADLDKVKEFL